MWKLFFDFLYFYSFFIFDDEKRNNFRINKLFDYRKKLESLKKLFIGTKIHSIRMIKGGWNIGFIINNKYVFKIRKKNGEPHIIDKIIREKRMTNAFRDIVKLQIPRVDIIEQDGYTFYKYEFIPGHNLNTFSLHTIMKHRKKWAKQIAKFIFSMHNADPKEIKDLKTPNGDSWGHNDICNNTIVDTKTMNIIGIIDWEYSGWEYLETEFRNCTRFSAKLRKADMENLIRKEYKKLHK